MQEFAVWLKNELEYCGMTQRDLAKILKMDEGHISRIINGKMIPSGSTIEKILKLFDCHIEIVENQNMYYI